MISNDKINFQPQSKKNETAYSVSQTMISKTAYREIFNGFIPEFEYIEN